MISGVSFFKLCILIAAQINPTIGDLKGIPALIREIDFAGKSEKADLVIFPELALCGYPPEDFILLPHLWMQCQAIWMEIISAPQGIAAHRRASSV